MGRAAVWAAGVLLVAAGVVGGMSAVADTEVNPNAQTSRTAVADVGTWSVGVVGGLVLLAGALSAAAVARHRSVPSDGRV